MTNIYEFHHCHCPHLEANPGYREFCLATLKHSDIKNYTNIEYIANKVHLGSENVLMLNTVIGSDFCEAIFLINNW